MDTMNPDVNFPPGSFGDEDRRDTHPIPGQEKRPPIYGDIGEELFDGAQPALGKGIEAGVGGGLPADVHRESDGYSVNAPDGESLDEAAPGDGQMERREDKAK